MIKGSDNNGKILNRFIRQHVALVFQGPIQLDLFQPQEKGHDFKVIVTSKQVKAKKVLIFRIWVILNRF